MSYLVASVAGVAFFVMSVALLGIWPRRVLEGQARAMAPEHVVALTASEARGRIVYAREGCAYCHTQQVRYLQTDVDRFGAPTLAWETQLDYPHLWGTRRIGPDLARAGSTRPEDWHFVHLYSPRAVVPDSVMPAYRAIFDGSPDRPRQEARDLVAYLETLGRARELAGSEGEARARAACHCEDDEMASMAFRAPALNAHPARAKRNANRPVLPPSSDLARGQRLFAANCAGCHGARGRGDGPGAVSLHPRPGNLAEHDYSQARLADALWNGVPGTAMQGWREHSIDDLADLAEAVRRLAIGFADPAPEPDVIERGRLVYAANCAQCHGTRGGGDGSAAAELRVPPTNFREQRASLAEGLRALREGIEGTPMAPWMGRLSDAEITAVAHYARVLYAPDNAGRPVAAR
jgi:cbb3-type cytochrome oxidase cytochrome c subunit